MTNHLSQIVCIVYVVPLHVRPKIQGLFGAFFGVASISGPLIGGGFTSNVTWRWCFYLNLPVGGAAMLIIALLLKIPQRDSEKLPLKNKLKQLDFPGSALFIPGIICLLLALQWGGQQYPVRIAQAFYSITVGLTNYSGVNGVSFSCWSWPAYYCSPLRPLKSGCQRRRHCHHDFSSREA